MTTPFYGANSPKVETIQGRRSEFGRMPKIETTVTFELPYVQALVNFGAHVTRLCRTSYQRKTNLVVAVSVDG